MMTINLNFLFLFSFFIVSGISCLLKIHRCNNNKHSLCLLMYVDETLLESACRLNIRFYHNICSRRHLSSLFSQVLLTAWFCCGCVSVCACGCVCGRAFPLCQIQEISSWRFNIFIIYCLIFFTLLFAIMALMWSFITRFSSIICCCEVLAFYFIFSSNSSSSPSSMCF